MPIFSITSIASDMRILSYVQKGPPALGARIGASAARRWRAVRTDITIHGASTR